MLSTILLLHEIKKPLINLLCEKCISISSRVGRFFNITALAVMQLSIASVVKSNDFGEVQQPKETNISFRIFIIQPTPSMQTIQVFS